MVSSEQLEEQDANLDLSFTRTQKLSLQPTLNIIPFSNHTDTLDVWWETSE